MANRKYLRLKQCSSCLKTRALRHFQRVKRGNKLGCWHELCKSCCKQQTLSELNEYAELISAMCNKKHGEKS